MGARRCLNITSCVLPVLDGEDAETVVGKPVVYSNNCFLKEPLGSLVISGFAVDAKVICE